MDTSQFTDNQPMFDSLEPIPTRGATCDTFRVKVYGKMHFLKRLKPEYSGDIRYKEAFHKEFETGYRLEHPHLARYVAFSDEGILMEYVDGETLTHLLSNNADYFKDKKNTDKLLSQLLDAVGYLHNHQVLHLDLKPDNILLTRINNDVKLIDLGCCYTDTFQDTQGRTDSFAAPEQLSGDTTDVRTDIFAIGKIMACLPNSSIYNKVIWRCTKPSPADRYQTIDDVRRAIAHKAHKTPLLLSLVFVLMLSTLGVALYLAQSKQEQPPVPPATSQADTVLSTLPSSPANTKQQSPKTDAIPLMQQELSQQIDKAYKNTIATFCDSLFPSPSVGDHWKQATEAFHRQTIQIGDHLTTQYPSVEESCIRQEIEERFQHLTTYVFNRMREN